MSDTLRQRILAVRNGDGADPEFSDRLLEGLARIEAGFDGPERERLLALVAETLDRHLEVRHATRSVRVSLRRLQADQRRLTELLELLLAPSEPTIH